ncbi:hypothetical protein OsI_04112 [Oryza sativa Indica Group]|uniref:Uncharacterized protein n=1 Tax=Oryza sativa subsp. indica TaxID=39946 RepID=B8AAW8_ORYSI|nr:hypothetical protein OsI_04112 [Oryza sativa Indica Group]
MDRLNQKRKERIRNVFGAFLKQSNPYPPILCSLIPSRAPPPQTSARFARFALISPPDALVRGLSAATTGYGLAGPGRSHGAREFHPELEKAEDTRFLDVRWMRLATGVEYVRNTAAAAVARSSQSRATRSTSR